MTNEEAVNLLRANVMVACDTSDKVGYGTPLNKAIEDALNMAINALEQQPSDDCVSRKFMYELGATCIATRDKNGKLIALGTIENLPPVTPCIAEIRFSKEDLRDICNERIEIECTHGTCKDCINYVVGALDEEICLRGHELIHKDFYCADFEKPGNENDSN